MIDYGCDLSPTPQLSIGSQTFLALCVLVEQNHLSWRCWQKASSKRQSQKIVH